MGEINKIFGIGMSKTGTTTLGTCLEILGFNPHIGFDPQLKKLVQRGGDLAPIFKKVENYKSFEDSPWYLLYRELDQRFPGSKFVLTVRKDSLTHAKSSWSHGVRRGQRTGPMTDDYLNDKIRVYEDHNNGVLEYFKDRPQDLLVMCWENGDGWDKLCSFLGVPKPGDESIPHSNQGRYQSPLPEFVSSSKPYNALVQGVHWLWLTTPVRKVKSFLLPR